MLEVARTVHAVVTGDAGLSATVGALSLKAAGPAQRAIAQGLLALVAAGENDAAEVLAASSRAVALLDQAHGGPERCLGYVVTAASLNTLRLWELVDELYALALQDAPGAALARQTEAVAVNRVIVGVEHGLALLETGEVDAAAQRLTAAAALVPAALALEPRPLWRYDVEGLRDVVALLLGTAPALAVEDHQRRLSAAGDVEVLPLLLAAHAWRAFHAHGDRGPAERLSGSVSTSSASASFPLWVRAQVLAADDGSAAAQAQREHADLLASRLWQARASVLSAARSAQAAERRRAEHELLSLAVDTDPLTGLLNRRRFDDWLSRDTGGDGPTALLLLDLDGFKSVNDRFGHACGDDVLRRVGLLLRAVVRPDDLAVRQGGDEFALVLRSSDLDATAVLSRAREVAAAVAGEPWESVTPGLAVSVSVGAALSPAGSDVTGADLYGLADRALYDGKAGQSGPVLLLAGTPAVADR